MDRLEIGYEEVHNFVNIKVWKQIVEDALSRALMASEENDMMDPLIDATKLARNQGEIKALKWMVDLPRVYEEEIEQDKQNEEKERKNG